MKPLNILETAIIAFALLVSKSLWAAQPLVQSSGVSEIEFQAFLLSESHFQPVSETLLKQRPLPVNAQELRDRYENAERAFLSADIATAHVAFVDVTDLALKDDWSPAQREIMFHSFLRAAQTSSNTHDRHALLRRAIRFARNLKADTNLFPPPLLREYEQLKTTEPLIPAQLRRQAFSKYSYAILNGEVIELKKYALQVPSGDFRLTLISDKVAPVTKVFSATDLSQWQPDSSPLVSGDCEASQFSKDVSAETAALFSESCIAHQMRPSKVAIEKYKPMDEGFSERILNTSTEYRPSSPSFFKNKWFWGAVGVAAAVIIHQNRDRGSDGASEPTVKQGF